MELTATLVSASPAPRLAPLRRPEHWRLLLQTLWGDHGLVRYWFNTRVEVAPGVYRSSHPLPSQLRAAQRAGIRTIISLRQPCPQIAANRLSWQTCERHGLQPLHFALSSRRAPSREEILGFDALLAAVEYPVLLHCKSGADRAGLASMLYLLLRTEVPLEQALQQLSFWRHGHLRYTQAGILDQFFEAYRGHRDRHGGSFRDWAERHYDRAAVEASFRARSWAQGLADGLLRRE